MRNSSEIWCETSDISMNEIEHRSCKEVEAGRFPTLVYISLDLLTELQKSAQASTRYSSPMPQPAGPTIVSIMTSAGHLNVVPVRRLRNFLLVGRKEDWEALEHTGIDQVFWNDEERKRNDKLFEDIVLKGDAQ